MENEVKLNRIFPDIVSAHHLESFDKSPGCHIWESGMPEKEFDFNRKFEKGSFVYFMKGEAGSFLHHIAQCVLHANNLYLFILEKEFPEIVMAFTYHDQSKKPNDILFNIKLVNLC